MHNSNDVNPPDILVLVAAARQGDEAALNCLLQHLRADLRQSAGRDLGDDLLSKLDGSDIVQQSLLEVQRDLADFRGTTDEEFQAWLLQIARRNVQDFARRFRDTGQRNLAREVRISDQQLNALPGNVPTGSSLVRRAETDTELINAIDQLPERWQQVIELRHRDGSSFADVAAALDVSEPAARQLWTRAVNALRERMTPGHAPPTPDSGNSP